MEAFVCRLGRMPTPEEEARHNLKELWPEGVVLTADAASLHAASIQPGNRGRASLLEEVTLQTLQAQKLEICRKTLPTALIESQHGIC